MLAWEASAYRTCGQVGQSTFFEIAQILADKDNQACIMPQITSRTKNHRPPWPHSPDQAGVQIAKSMTLKRSGSFSPEKLKQPRKRNILLLADIVILRPQLGEYSG